MCIKAVTSVKLISRFKTLLCFPIISHEWLSVPDRVRFFKLAHLFKIRHGNAPPYLSNGLVSLLQTHSHFTRGSQSNYRVSHELSLAPSSFVFTIIANWNGLPVYLKMIRSLSLFKKKVKEYFVSQYWFLPGFCYPNRALDTDLIFTHAIFMELLNLYQICTNIYGTWSWH